MQRRILICCGITTGGKSYWQEKIREALDLPRNYGVDLDEVRVENFGRERRLTDEEHLFKNELVRIEVKKRFIIDKAETVIVGAVMLTIRNHQLPMVEMAESLEAKIYGLWFVCSSEASEQRLAARRSDPNTLCDVTTMEGLEKGAKRFEPPALYPFIQIDTSDESPEADAERLRQIFEFIST